MSERDLEEIEKRVGAATEGPWEVEWISEDVRFRIPQMEHENLHQKGENYWFASRARQDIPNLLNEVRRSHTEAAELREELRKAKVVGKSLLEEHMIPKHLQGKFTAGPGTEGKDIIVCERCNFYVTEQVEGILETRSVWERENAELREEIERLEEEMCEPGLADTFAANALTLLRENAELRESVKSLKGALARFENWLEVTATYAVSKVKRDYAEFTLKELRAALSQASAPAKLEARSEEE